MKAKEQTKTLRRHHLSSFVPVDKRAIAALVESMRKDGYREQFPILLMKDADTGEDVIVDGWHRYQASIESGVEPVFKHLSDLGIATGNGELTKFVVAANVCRRQMNSKKLVLSLLRSGIKGLSESTLMNMTGASSSTVRGGLAYHQLLPKKTQQALLDGNITTATADSAKSGGSVARPTRTRAPKTSPPSLSALIIAEMVLVQSLEKISWIKVWQEAAKLYVAAVKGKHKHPA